ncbi:MAG: OmpA family protein [Alistipes sp.]
MATVLFAGVVGAHQSKTDKSVEFRPHWYLQLQGGAAYTLGEADFGNLVSPAAFLSAGYKFHPAWGVRVGIGGWQGKGCAVVADNTYKFDFVQGNIDLMLDFSSLVGGFNHRRVCSVFVFAGLGVLGGVNNDEAVALADAGEPLSYLWRDSKCFVSGRLGLGVDFRVGERVNLNIEANSAFLSDHFNSKKAGNLDWQFNLLAGVSFRFGKNHRESAVYAAEQAAAEAAAKAAAEKRAAEQKAEVERIAAEKAAAEKALAAKQAAERAAAERAAAEKAAAEHAAAAKEHSENIFFRIGSAVIRKAEMKKLDALVEWMKSNADYGVAVVGYADKETGSAALNKHLSAQRAENVRKYMVKTGVEADRIVVDSKGDTVQPFQVAAQNRVVICTLE